MRITYLASRYPAISHVFVLREVEAVRQRGIDVRTLTVRRVDPKDLLSTADRREAAQTYALVPPRRTDFFRAHVRAAITRPGRYFGVLGEVVRRPAPGVRARLWQVFYFAEAILVWWWCQRQGIRHIHAHFANVASDVASLTARFGDDREHGEPFTWSFMMHGSAELFDVTSHRLADKVRSADFVACASDFGRSQLMGLVPSKHWSKLSVVRCGLDVDGLGEPRAHDSRDDGRLRLLTVGRLVPVKGHGVLIQALHRLREAGVDASLVIVGDGPERQATEQLVHELDLSEHVQLAGAVGADDVAAFYDQADVFCLPSFTEGLPVVLLEALSKGLPAVASRIAGVPELIEDGASGLLVTPGRPDELAEAIGSLQDPERRAALGRAGRERVLEEFTATLSAERLENLLIRYAAGA